MRIRSIRINHVPPVKRFEVEELSDVIVIAGRNGIGKTRLLKALINFFQKPSAESNIKIEIDGTCESEFTLWNKRQLDTNNVQDAGFLLTTLQKVKRRRHWKSSIISFESDRSILKIQPYAFSFDALDPDEEKVGWNSLFSGLRDRFQDTLHSIFRKVHSHRNKISTKVEKLMRQGKKTMDLDFEDPLLIFKHAFRQLLAPKVLLDADLGGQQLKYSEDGQEFPITSLSSGEREVLNIVFDFILRNPNDCIVFFDEPELHLHPELSYKLIQTLTSLGQNNQFILCTHSPDIITASLDHSVIFIGPCTENCNWALQAQGGFIGPICQASNQALQVHEDDETNMALKHLGQSIGVIALGKKLVLIEGGQSSLDKQTYGTIIEDKFPNLVLVPSGGKDLIRSFSSLNRDVLQKSIWGVEFFMVCDRDIIPISKDLETLSKGRLKILDRYHLENYFLDEIILAEVFSNVEPEESWLRNPEAILDKLKEIAQKMISYAVALHSSSYFRESVGNIDLMPKGCQDKTKEELTTLFLAKSSEELSRVKNSLRDTEISQFIEETTNTLNNSFDNGDWKKLVPGRPVLNSFAQEAKMPVGRLKLAYLNEALKSAENPFNEILAIFESFNKFGE